MKVIGRLKISQLFFKQNTKRYFSSHQQQDGKLDISITSQSITFGIGLVAGGVGSLVGLGGSFLALPLLTSILKLNQHLAHGTTMASVLCTSLGGTIAYMMKNKANLPSDFEFPTSMTAIITMLSNLEVIGNVHLLTAGCLSLASSMTVIFGAKLSKQLSVRTLKLSMGVLLLSVAPLIPFREHLKTIATPSTTPATSSSEVKSNTLHIDIYKPLSIGAITGIISGTFGVGGGALQVPALSLLTPLPYHMTLGTSLAGMYTTDIYLESSLS
jgi:uncharacterized protein